MTSKSPDLRLSSGVEGLDQILGGGFIPERAYLVKGGPGSGKTTLCLQFLRAGADNGEKSMFISLSETEDQLRDNAAAMGINVSGIEFLHLGPASTFFTEVETYDIFSPAEVERGPITGQIVSAVERLQPRRVVIDTITQMRYLASDPAQYRRQVLSFLRFLSESASTVLYTSEASSEAPDEDLQYLGDGIIELKALNDRRTLCVTKLRGSDFRPGKHTLKMTGRGMEVYARLVPDEHRRNFSLDRLSSGVDSLDAMIAGGIERGTVTTISGPSGVGKSTMVYQFATASAERGELAVVYSFDEELSLILARCEGTSIPVRRLMEQDLLRIEKVEPLILTPDEFAMNVRRQVEESGARMVVLDSISGYRISIRGGDYIIRIHALTKYLSNMGVTVIIVDETNRLTGASYATEGRLSYLSDTIMLLRYIEERNGEGHLEMGRALWIIKKRLSEMDRLIRKFSVTRSGLEIGPPVTRFLRSRHEMIP